MKSFLLTLTILAATLTSFGQPMTREAAELVARGDSCMLMNDTYNSMLCYEQANQLGSSDTVMHKLAQCYFKRGQYAKCLALTSTLMADTVLYQHIKLHYNCLQKMGVDDSLRIDCAQRLVAINPMDAAVVADIANYYNDKQLADTALSYCQAYYAIDSTNQQINKQMGRAFFIKKDYYRALDLFLEAYNNGDENPATLFYIGRTYECCSIPDKAHDFMLMAAKNSDFESLAIVKALARVSNTFKYRDEVLDYTQIAFELCQADSASMAELYQIRANFYSGYQFSYRDDSVKQVQCLKNCVKMLKKSVEYKPSMNAMYELAASYQRLKDPAQEKYWLQKMMEWPRDKSTREHIRYAEWRLKQIEEEEFFKGGKKSSNL